jgi:hypothetical protein
MLVHSKISRIAAAAIMTAVVAVPSASAMPIDGPGGPGGAGSQTETGSGTVAPDLRTESNRGLPASPTPPVGLPTWPTDPEPIVPATAEPVAATDGDGGLDSTTTLIIAAGVLALSGGLVVLVRQLRLPPSRAAH